MKHFEVHRAARQHVPGIQRVRAAVRENRLVSRRISDDEVIEAIESTGIGFVALINAQVVGFSIGHTTTGNIWALFVDPDFEGRGIGRKLFHVLVDSLAALGLKNLHLSTDPGTRAERFYRACGWQCQGLDEQGEVRFKLSLPT